MDQATQPPPRQFPISYIRAFAYHPVAFPQPLAPITTYQVTRNPQSYNPNRSYQAGNGGSYQGGGGGQYNGGSNFNAGNAINALSQAIQQKFIQSQEASQNGFSPMGSGIPLPPTQQQLPSNSQVDFGTPPTTTTTTTTTTPVPPTTMPPPMPQQVFTGSQPIPQLVTRSGFTDGGYQRQMQFPQSYGHQGGNFGGFPQFFNQPQPQPQYTQQFSPYQYGEQVSSGRLFGAEPQFQQFSPDPLTYQFIPTSITPLPNQNNIKFVPCMCPVAVSVSPPLPEKRTDEIPILSSPTTETETVPQPAPVAPPTQQLTEERK